MKSAGVILNHHDAAKSEMSNCEEVGNDEIKNQYTQSGGFNKIWFQQPF